MKVILNAKIAIQVEENVKDEHNNSIEEQNLHVDSDMKADELLNKNEEINESLWEAHLKSMTVDPIKQDNDIKTDDNVNNELKAEDNKVLTEEYIEDLIVKKENISEEAMNTEDMKAKEVTSVKEDIRHEVVDIVDNTQAQDTTVEENTKKKKKIEEEIKKIEEDNVVKEEVNTNEEAQNQIEVENKTENEQKVNVDINNESSTEQEEELSNTNDSLEENITHIILTIKEEQTINKKDIVFNNTDTEIIEEPHIKQDTPEHTEEVIDNEEPTAKKYVQKAIHLLGEVVNINIKTFLYASDRVKEQYDLEYPYNHLLVAFMMFIILYCISNLLPGSRKSSVVI
jgi:hypothetical protein